MTVLGKIRSRPWILIGFVAIALLAFLVNPDSLEKVFGRNPNVFGKVNGEEITRDEFNDQLSLLQQQAQSQGQPTFGLEEQTWQMLVQAKLVKQQFEKMGMTLTEDVFWNQIQYDPMFSKNPENFDAKGNFKTLEIKKQIEQLQKGENPELYANWLKIRKSMEYGIMARLLFANISSGITSNKKEVIEMMRQRDEMASIEYVKIDYNEFSRKNPIKVSTQDLADYMEKHPLLFKSDASRNLGIVFFKSEPSTSDDKVALAEINKIYTEGIDHAGTMESFQNTKNDSIFVANNSEIQNPYRYVSEQELPKEAQVFVKESSAGQFLGPYKSDAKFWVTKLLGKGEASMPKHILISHSGVDKSIKRPKEEAKKIAEDIAVQVKANPTTFNQFLQLSSDVSSAQQGGNVGWVLPESNQFVKPFGDFVKSNPKGTVGIVETQFGYHIIVIENKIPVYKVANLVKDIKISDATENKIHTSATSFIQKTEGKSFNEFSNTANKNKYNFQNLKSVKRFQGVLQGLETDKDNDILAWAFDKKREKGDTDIFTTSNGDRIVVFLNGKQNDGIADPESVREQLEPIVKNKLLAKKIIDKINSIKVSDLGQIAKVFSTQKQVGQVNLLNPTLGQAIEPKVAGAAFGITNNKVSQPVEGNTGVYVVVKKTTSVQKQGGNPKQIAESISKQNSGMFTQSFLKSLQDGADIKDYRIEIYNKLNQVQ